MANLDRLEDQIAKQQERLKQLKAQKQAAQAREKAREKKLTRQQETRRRILLGSYLASVMDESDEARHKTLSRLDGYLKRDDDRALFGLPPIQTDQSHAEHQLVNNQDSHAMADG